MIKPRDGEYYWIKCEAYDPENPVMIGKYRAAFRNDDGAVWVLFDDDWFNHDNDVKVIKRIPRPRATRGEK